jgi:hypothetical protein
VQPSGKACFQTRELEPNRKLSPDDHLLSILALVGAGSKHVAVKHASKLEKKVMLGELEPAL